MIRIAVAAAVGAAAASGAGAVWAATMDTPKAIVLEPDQAVAYAGLTCTAYAGTTDANANIVCVRNDLRGVGVVISRSTVVVARRTNGTIRVVFRTKNQ